MKPQDAEVSDSADAPTSRRWWAWAVALVAAALAVWYVCDNAKQWKDRFVPRKLRTVDAGMVYASGQIDQHLIRKVLLEDRIKVIVCLLSDDPNDPDMATEARTAHELGIERFVDPLNGDGTGNIRSYADALTQIVEARKRGEAILLHCSSGAQRSNGATFYYRVLVEHWDADSAAREMVRNGYSYRHNPSLVPYLNEHIGEIAAILKDRGVIDQIPNPLPQIHHE